MTSTDLKPGDLVQHAEFGPGLVGGGEQILYLARDGFVYATFDPTGWERAETVRPGHVQVRVDDLDLSHWLNKPDDDNIWGESARVAIRAANAIAAQRAESTPPAVEKPTSATVTLYCPDCGEAIRDTAMVVVNRGGGRYLGFCTADAAHTCPPAQPDEPTEFGARVTVTLPDGTREKWCRLGKHHPAPWLGETYEVPGEAWSLLCGRGTVTIGWDE